MARTVFGLLGLLIGSLVIAAPFIPLWENAFAFLLAAGGLLYPEIRKGFCDNRHSRLLNRLIVEAEAYQKNERIHYVSEAQLEEELAELDRAAKKGPQREGERDGNVVRHPGGRGRER